MADKPTFDEEVPNYTDGEPLNLEVGSRDGQVYIGLYSGGDPPAQRLKCIVEPAVAEQVITALRESVREVQS